NTSILEKYRVPYEGIARANARLRILPDAQPDVSEADKLRIAAEARFLRGHYYFELKRLFNNTPYIDENVDYNAGIEETANDKNLRPMIKADYQIDYDNLPETQQQPGRANKWAAGAFLGKVKLYQKRYAVSKSIFDVVIPN